MERNIITRLKKFILKSEPTPKVGWQFYPQKVVSEFGTNKDQVLPGFYSKKIGDQFYEIYETDQVMVIDSNSNRAESIKHMTLEEFRETSEYHKNQEVFDIVVSLFNRVN
ncbi:hypothetical protein BH10PAT1_BH10PAT1_7800 [soil metagenome]